MKGGIGQEGGEGIWVPGVLSKGPQQALNHLSKLKIFTLDNESPFYLSLSPLPANSKLINTIRTAISHWEGTYIVHLHAHVDLFVQPIHTYADFVLFN